MSYFLNILGKFLWFLVFYVISVLMLRKRNFAVVLSNKWLVKNKVSTLLHYYFWRNSEWLFSKSPHCQCLKIKFETHFTRLFHNGLSQQHSNIRKKLNMVSWHNLLTSTLFKGRLDCFGCFEIFLFFGLPCNFISVNAKEMELCSYIKYKR